eukprot:GILJ01013856.1.p1 GENE.GILJ01013856.1~~GILJ01013856.1.p1  ORF type:complete len:241 (-),score=38.60 GILJ01013856.1:162-884(-)
MPADDTPLQPQPLLADLPHSSDAQPDPAGQRLHQSLQSQPQPLNTVTSETAMNSVLEKAVHMSSQRSSVPNFNASGTLVDYDCEELESHRLHQIGTTFGSVPLCIEDGATDSESIREASQFFAQLLVDLAKVFGLHQRSIHVYIGSSSSRSVAFNRGGCLYFNVVYFERMHYRKNVPQGRSHLIHADAVIYWYMVMCHELSHNLVTGHNKDHEAYLEMFAVRYLSGLIQFMHSVGFSFGR